MVMTEPELEPARMVFSAIFGTLIMCIGIYSIYNTLKNWKIDECVLGKDDKDESN